MAKKPKPPRPPKPVPPPPDPPVGAATGVCFVWDAVAGATSYTVQVGSTSGASDLANVMVGNVLTATVPVTPGVRYCRVMASVVTGDGATTSTTPEVRVVLV